ncbi:MAG: Gfo/Idh/MocA family oxidoreductase, partial [Acidobacteria bacterium]|nr:Gfo/Idh/MocA family oxidoreductase [Acidobacteriota bacterium]
MLRRDLLKRVTSAATAMTAASYSRVMGANDTVQLGLIGSGERGRHVMNQFLLTNQVNVGAVCDIYSENIDKARQKATNARNFADHRKLLEVKELDAVLIATPDHWHFTTACDAMRAGKDVYVEKPLTLKIEEGPEIVKVARMNDRVCQVGMQQRSGVHYIRAKKEYIDTGKLGKISLVRTWWHGNTYHLRKAPESLATRPSNLDWGR